MLRSVAWAICRAKTTFLKSGLISTTSEVSIATSVPLPIAIPTAAWAMAGLSLIPSPTNSTGWPLAWSSFKNWAFSLGNWPALTWVIPTICATDWATFSWSPVTIHWFVTPVWRSCLSALATPGRTWSDKPIANTKAPSTIIKITDCPFSRSFCKSTVCLLESFWALGSKIRGLPNFTWWPCQVAVTPIPLMVVIAISWLCTGWPVRCS